MSYRIPVLNISKMSYPIPVPNISKMSYRIPVPNISKMSYPIPVPNISNDISNIKISNGDRTDLIKYIQKMKNIGPFTVIDIGGAIGGWSTPYVDAVIDMNSLVNTSNESVKVFNGDITTVDGWKAVLDYVNENGMFDFSICTHTLEDIINPKFVCEYISKISKAGYIAFPSKHAELARNIEYDYRGCIHHRWIHAIKNSVVYAWPKLNVIEHISELDSVASTSLEKRDLSFYWKDKITIEYVNNNYMTSGNHIISFYKQLCDPAFT